MNKEEMESAVTMICTVLKRQKNLFLSKEKAGIKAKEEQLEYLWNK